MTILSLAPPDGPYYRTIAADLDYNLHAEVTVSEDHEDELMITAHPVNIGAIMTDHAYKQPPEVRVRVGWSAAYGGYAAYARDIYQTALTLQLRRELFQLYTGKRFYKNMLVGSIHVVTDQLTEYVFVADILFKQVFLSSSQTIAAQTLSARRAAQADPTKTGQTQDMGRTQLQGSSVDPGLLEGGAPSNAGVSGNPDNNPLTAPSSEAGTITNSNNGGATFVGPEMIA